MSKSITVVQLSGLENHDQAIIIGMLIYYDIITDDGIVEITQDHLDALDEILSNPKNQSV